MNILSLFDGMSCGQIALNNLGFKIDNYYASEVDNHAIKVCLNNYPSTIQLGDVKKVNISQLPKIDLLLGGSPCQGFSFAGKQLNFNDERSRLFFEYVRILNDIKKVNPNVFFLLENVKMKKDYQDIISKYLGVQPILINSSLVSAQNRERLYWTNIKNITQPVDENIHLHHIVNDNYDLELEIDPSKTINRDYKKNYLQYDINGKGNGSQDQRAYYLHGKHGCLDTGAASKAKILLPNGRVRKLMLNEAERLQNICDNYTSSVSKSQAFKMLGNGWTIKVIEHILKGINP